jgi:hypothetical protein
MFRARGLIEPEFSERQSQLHVVQDFAIHRKSYCSRAAAAAAEKSLLLTIIVCVVHECSVSASARAEDTKELQIARLRT